VNVWPVRTSNPAPLRAGTVCLFIFRLSFQLISAR
jgi:hypothetical protein